MTTPAAASDIDEQALRVRGRIAEAGRELFSLHGYDRTTVDAIAAQAGVARRTFFRHFRGKDDVIFMDHARVLRTVETFLAEQDDAPALSAISDAVLLVLRGYLSNPRVSVQCYELIRSVPALRDREIAWVSSYTRSFARYLRHRLGTDAESLLVADVTAATVVATHNHVLRTWLRSGGVGDPTPELQRALAWLASRMALPGVGDEAVLDEEGRPVVVAVFRSDASVDELAERISRSI